MPPTGSTLRRWWPSTQSLDLVEGSVEAVADAVHAEYSRFLNGERINASWSQFRDIDEAFRSVPEFRNAPTCILVLPTRSKWTVLWNNSFLCSGYDSLCWCLSSHHHLTTLHWSAHDEWTTFQSGASFTHRRHNGTTLVERSVYCGQEDERWVFYAAGQPLDEEDVSDYNARRRRDRLNERSLLALLSRLGAGTVVG